jgi:hypothetical protein
LTPIATDVVSSSDRTTLWIRALRFSTRSGRSSAVERQRLRLAGGIQVPTVASNTELGRVILPPAT